MQQSPLTVFTLQLPRRKKKWPKMISGQFGSRKQVLTADLKNRSGSSNSLVCDESIGGHLGKITRSSVFVSKSYCKASEISLECRQQL